MGFSTNGPGLWYATRATGLVTLLLLTASVLLGVLTAGRFASEHPNMHIIYITNFKCGPDSFVKHYLRDVAKVPFLVLQFDGHGNDAGYLTRCEAYLDSKGLLRCTNTQ